MLPAQGTFYPAKCWAAHSECTAVGGKEPLVDPALTARFHGPSRRAPNRTRHTWQRSGAQGDDTDGGPGTVGLPRCSVRKAEAHNAKGRPETLGGHKTQLPFSQVLWW